MSCPNHPGNLLSRFDVVLPDLASLAPDIAVVALAVAIVVGCPGLLATFWPARVQVGSASRLASSMLLPVALVDVLGVASGAPVESSIVLRATSGALVVGLGCGLLWLASRVGRRQ